jgi:hypothetical protein
MTRLRHPHIDAFDIDRLDINHATNDAPPPPRRQSNAQQVGPSYWWNATTQELIPILHAPQSDMFDRSSPRYASSVEFNAARARI